MLKISITQDVNTSTTAHAPKPRKVSKGAKNAPVPADNVRNTATPDLVQLNTSTEFELDVKSSRANVGQVVGTILNEVFATMDLYRSCGSRYISAAAPLQIRFNLGRSVIDTGTLDRRLQAKLRCGYTAKGRKRFARVLWNLVQWTLRDVQPVTIEDVNAELEKQIEAALTA